MVERAFGNNSPGAYSKKADVYIGNNGLNRNAQSMTSLPQNDLGSPPNGYNAQYLNNKNR